MGEAPDEVRNCFQQRSRWCKVHSPLLLPIVWDRLHRACSSCVYCKVHISDLDFSGLRLSNHILYSFKHLKLLQSSCNSIACIHTLLVAGDQTLKQVMHTQGHFQIMFNRKYCPLLQRELSPLMRIMYCSGVWSYIVGALTTPLFIIIPLLTIWAGVFPIVVSWWAAGDAYAHPLSCCSRLPVLWSATAGMWSAAARCLTPCSSDIAKGTCCRKDCSRQ